MGQNEDIVVNSNTIEDMNMSAYIDLIYINKK